MTAEKICGNMTATNPVPTDAPTQKEEKAFSGIKITALYCRLSQEDERLGDSVSIENQLEAIACGTAGGYGYEMRREARRNIRDAALRESIDVKMTEEEQRWYDYDIKSGM